MKAASSSTIKAALKQLSSSDLVDLCLRLARSKKENKELLSFILFESDNIDAFISSSKEGISDSFKEINTTNLYFAKKSIRRILRETNKLIKYAGSKNVEVELLLHFCKSLDQSSIPYKKSPAIFKLYLTQVKKIRTAIDTMHEDLQYDYLKALEKLN